MKHSFNDLCSSATNLPAAALATDAKDARWRHDRAVAEMTVAEQSECLGLISVTNQKQAKRRSCVAGIHRLSFR